MSLKLRGSLERNTKSQHPQQLLWQAPSKQHPDDSSTGWASHDDDCVMMWTGLLDSEFMSTVTVVYRPVSVCWSGTYEIHSYTCTVCMSTYLHMNSCRHTAWVRVQWHLERQQKCNLDQGEIYLLIGLWNKQGWFKTDTRCFQVVSQLNPTLPICNSMLFAGLCFMIGGLMRVAPELWGFNATVRWGCAISVWDVERYTTVCVCVRARAREHACSQFVSILVISLSLSFKVDHWRIYEMRPSLNQPDCIITPTVEELFFLAHT